MPVSNKFGNSNAAILQVSEFRTIVFYHLKRYSSNEVIAAFISQYFAFAIKMICVHRYDFGR